jgi:hypothetical protein
MRYKFDWKVQVVEVKMNLEVVALDNSYEMDVEISFAMHSVRRGL